MRDSVILTVFDRPMPDLIQTLRALVANDLKDTEVVIVDDGSTEDYSWTKEMLEQAGVACTFERMPEYEAYRIGGHNNPAKANNRALELATGDRIFWLSSDMRLQPGTLTRARKFVGPGVVWTPQTVDLDTAQVFHGPSRVFPMMWVVGCAASDARVGFDEEYLKGMAFEDNDYMGRLALRAGTVICDWSVTAWHQSHSQTAYSDEMVGFKRSEDYTLSKWGGVPWRGGRACFSAARKPHELGPMMLEVRPLEDGLAAKVAEEVLACQT